MDMLAFAESRELLNRAGEDEPVAVVSPHDEARMAHEEALRRAGAEV